MEERGELVGVIDIQYMLHLQTRAFAKTQEEGGARQYVL